MSKRIDFTCRLLKDQAKITLIYLFISIRWNSVYSIIYDNIALHMWHSCFVTFNMVTLLSCSVWQPSRWSALDTVQSVYTKRPKGTNPMIMDIHNWIMDIFYLQYDIPNCTCVIKNINNCISLIMDIHNSMCISIIQLSLIQLLIQIWISVIQLRISVIHLRTSARNSWKV